MGVKAAMVGPWKGWGTWEELILGGAVLRHGIKDWNVVASELRARTVHSFSITPEVCKAKYEELQKRYCDSTAWFEELRKQRVEELKRELARSDDSIGSLELKIKSLEAEKQNSNKADHDSSWTESPLPALNSDVAESSYKGTPKDETSAGSFTLETRTATNWLCQSHHQETETDSKPGVSVSSEQDKDLITENPAGYGQGIIRKRRGQRKRKDCHLAPVDEGSIGDSENFGSSNAVSTAPKETCTSSCDQITKTARKHNLMDIFNSIADSEPATVFQHRMDSQKRARYRKVIRQHLDIGTVRSRIMDRTIKTVKELFRDLLLLANNALVFYSKRTREYKSAVSLRQVVVKEYRQHCRDRYCREATSAFLASFSPLVKPRSARPRPRPVPQDIASEKVAGPDKVLGPVNTHRKGISDKLSEQSVLLKSLLKGKKGVKRPLKSKTESGDKRHENRPVKQQRRRVER